MIHSSGRVQRRRAARLDALTDSAFDLLPQWGLNGLTVQRLAKEMDWSVGAMYRYFPSKDALLVHLQCRVLNDLKSQLQTALSNPAVPERAAERILLCVDRFIAFASERPSHFQLLAAVLSDPRQLLPEDEAHTVGEAMEGLMTLIDGQFREASERGEIGPGEPRRRTLQLWAALHGLLQLGKLGRLEAHLTNPGDLARDLAQTLLLGWGLTSSSLSTKRPRRSLES